MATLFVASNSCSEDEEKGDTTKPVINLVEPKEGDVLHIGGDVHFDLELSDDVMLDSYKVDIHHNFDGHTHAVTKGESDTKAFEFEKTWSISGKRNVDIHHHEIVIPEDATPGDYHLMVYCTDAAGNEEHIAVNIKLSHEEGEDHDHDHDHEDEDEHDD
jgi:hypothetical protein